MESLQALVLTLTVTVSLLVNAQSNNFLPFLTTGKKSVLADVQILKKAQIPILKTDLSGQVGYAVVSNIEEFKISKIAHQFGRCGNYEYLADKELSQEKVYQELQLVNTAHAQQVTLYKPFNIVKSDSIEQAISELQTDNIKQTVLWLSSYPTRFNKGQSPNEHIQPFIDRLKALAQNYSHSFEVTQIAHTSTKQKSVKFSLTGKTKPNEVIVLGGHLDSINGWFGTGRAPGADDNASGSASLVEALRVFLAHNIQPERTVEFYWYAGEESGLLGSAEIAKAAKSENKNIKAVLQLDMTLFPGNGANTIASMSDFTAPWLRDYMNQVNKTYLNITVLDDKCGYGCSDHASWHRQGFATLFPTEATFNSVFQQIHTDKDVVSSVMSFDHALIFSKIALIFAMDLSQQNLF